EQRPNHVSVVVGDGRRVARTHNRNVGAGVVGAARVAPVQNQRVNRTANRVPKVLLDNVKHVRGVGERSLTGNHNNGGTLAVLSVALRPVKSEVGFSAASAVRPTSMPPS